MFFAFFVVGLVGFVLMAAMGFIHVGSHGGHGSTHAVSTHRTDLLGHASRGAQPLNTHAQATQARIPVTGAKTFAKGSLARGDRAANIFVFLSPVTIFSLMMGAGVTGLLLEKTLAGAALYAACLAGGLGFFLGIIRPLTNYLANFASRPSEGLEGMVAKSAVAQTRFDSKGRGLITLTLDGQNVQVLAMLEPDEIQRGITVAKGDPVTIVEVDQTRNTCRVTRELAD